MQSIVGLKPNKTRYDFMKYIISITLFISVLTCNADDGLYAECMDTFNSTIESTKGKSIDSRIALWKRNGWKCKKDGFYEARLAEMLISNHDYEQAQDLILKQISLNKYDTYELISIQTMIAIETNHLDYAKQTSKHLINKCPECYQGYILLADSCFFSNELESALYYYKKSLNIKPDSYEAYLGLAKIYYKLKKYKKCIDNYMKAFELEGVGTFLNINASAAAIISSLEVGDLNIAKDIIFNVDRMHNSKIKNGIENHKAYQKAKQAYQVALEQQTNKK